MKDDKLSKPIVFSAKYSELKIPQDTTAPTITNLGITLAVVLVLLRIFREILSIYREYNKKSD